MISIIFLCILKIFGDAFVGLGVYKPNKNVYIISGIITFKEALFNG